VTAARFSPSGTKLLSCSSDNTGVVWDLAGARKKVLLGHINDITTGFFSEDESKVVTGSLDGSIKGWDLNIYAPPVLRGHSGPVQHLDVHPDNQHLCSTGIDSTIIVWESNSSGNKIVARLKLGESISKPKFSNSGNKILALSSSNRALVWEWQSQSLPIFLKGHSQSVIGARFWGNDSVVTVAEDRTIRFWDKSGTCYKVISRPLDQFSCLDVSNDFKKVVVGTNDGSVLALNRHEVICDSLNKHKRGKRIISCKFSLDGDKIVTTSADNTAIIWHPEKHTSVVLDKAVFAPYYQMRLSSARFSSDGKYVVTASSDRTARIWNLDGTLKTTLFGHADNIKDAGFTAHGRIYTVSDDRTVRYWEIDGSEIAVYTYDDVGINSLIMDKKSEKLITALNDGSIRVKLTAKGIYNWVKENHAYKYYRTHKERYLND
jgi:WD40 repeat protein